MEEKDDNIRKKIKSLDTTFPKVAWNTGEVWNAIDSRKNVSRRLGWSIAAAAILAITILFWPSNNEKISISYREEKISSPDTASGTAWTFIERSCKENIAVCESKEFVELRTQWKELYEEHKALDDEEKNYGSNPALTKAKKKVESVKQDLEKEMMTMIGS